jgi:diguanylate cyclase (GGDEF)-like protein
MDDHHQAVPARRDHEPPTDPPAADAHRTDPAEPESPDHHRAGGEEILPFSRRDRAAAGRDRGAADRDRKASGRDRSQAAADVLRLNRDQAAAERDYAAAERDLVASTRERSRAEVGHPPLDRIQAGHREHAASDRDLTASDRDQSRIEADQRTADRGLAAADRERAAADRAKHAADRDVDRAEAAEDRAAATRDRERARAELRHAQLDGVTGAFGRTLGMVMLEREISRARRSSGHLVLAYVELDGLKRVNDRRGHEAGDALLRLAVAAIRAHLRSYDPIVRVGGDQFLCALGNCTPDGAETRFEQIRATLRATQPGASVAVGLAPMQPEDTLAELMRRADLALYEAKHPGIGAETRDETPGATIVIADDAQDMLLLVRSALERDGHRVLSATDGQAALELIRRELPDLCVLDVMMPKLTGFEVTQALRAHEASRATRVILLTGRSHATDIAHGFDCGTDDYLLKPFDPKELRLRVRALLSR